MHSFEAFPSDIPCAVVGKAGVSRFAPIPPGAHEGNGIEETAVAWQIYPETVVLVIMAIG